MAINIFQAHGQIYYDPTLVETDKGVYSKNTVMVRRSYKSPNTSKYEYDYIPIIVRGKQAEYMNRCCNRLDFVYVVGRLISTNNSSYVEVTEFDMDHVKKGD